MSTDIQSLHDVLKHPIRRRIVLTLHERKDLAYTDLMNLVEVENTGKLNYHLKILCDLVEKDENGRYRLTEKGETASQLLQRFPEKKAERLPLRGGDAILIGFVGFLIAQFNPGFWGLLFGVAWIYLGVMLGVLYALFVPGFLNWWLAVRRTNYHDLYDLFKPSLVTFALFILLLVIMVLLNPQDGSGYVGIPVLSLLLYMGRGSLLFLGTGISELIHRVLKKRSES